MEQVNYVRAALVMLCFVGLFCIAVVHVFFMQTVKSSFFAKIARQQYQIRVTQRPPRAPIFDRNKTPLALNKEVLSAFITPNNLNSEKEVKEFLRRNFPEAYHRLKNKNRSCFMYIKRQLSDKEVALINKAQLPDIQFIHETRRFYPHQSLGTTIGVTNIDNDGIAGIELVFNHHLAGSPTTYLLEKDARSHRYYFKKETTQKGLDGLPVTLTIDAGLQCLAYDALHDHMEQIGAREGAVLIMDPTSGDILTMACIPDFDPNIPISDLSLTKNRILTEVREFGSVMKPFTALAALEEKVVTPDEIIDCEGKKETYVNGIKITTWKAFGPLAYTDVLRKSNNIGTSKVALRIDPTALYNHLRDCGFGTPSGLHFPGEQNGYLTPPQKWSKSTAPHLSFGYEISATMLQLARGFATIANGGYLVTPRLVLDPPPQKIPSPKKVFSSETINQMRNMITLNEEHTAAKGSIPGYTVLGKTGSAFTLNNGVYDQSRSIYTFSGIVEKGPYRRLVIVFIREPRPMAGHVYASTIAVPLFREIAEQMIIKERIL